MIYLKLLATLLFLSAGASAVWDLSAWYINNHCTTKITKEEYLEMFGDDADLEIADEDLRILDIDKAKTAILFMVPAYYVGYPIIRLRVLLKG